MGAIVRRGTKDRPRFYLKYVDANGTQRTRAAKGAINQKHAERMLAEVERNIFNGKLGIEEPTEDDQAKRTITVRELGEAFTTRYTDRKVKNVAAYRKAQLTVLEARIYEKLGARAAASVTKREVDAFLQGLTDDDYKPSSVNNTLNVLSKLYRWARTDGLIDCANPCTGVGRFKSDDDEGAPIEPDKFLKREEAQKLLAYAEAMAVVGVASWDALMLAPMIAVALYAGLRKGELFGLKWTYVDLERGQLTVARSYGGKPKSGKARHVPISPRLTTILRGWRDRCPKTDAGLVFPALENAGEMGASWDMLGLEGAMKAAEVRVPPKPFHALRHSFASHFMMAGGNILTLQKLLGHADVTTTMIYAHLAPDFMAAEVARLDFSAPLPAGVADIAEARRRKILEQLDRDPEALWSALEQVAHGASEAHG